MDNAEEIWKQAQRSVPQHLDKLKGMVNTRIAAGPTMPKKQATKACPVCGVAYDHQVLRNRPEPRVWLCKSCMDHMQKGETAFVCVDKRFCFVLFRSGTQDLQNHVIQDISVEDFGKLLAKANGDTAQQA